MAIILQVIGGVTVGVGIALGIWQLSKMENPLKRYVKKVVNQYLKDLSKED
jgi:hypothetical protein